MAEADASGLTEAAFADRNREPSNLAGGSRTRGD
jgi:hypothetical protein